MPPTFPCPNPVCTHAFSPDAVRGSSSLVCPKCGTIFHFGPGSTTPPRPATAPKRPAPPSVKPSISLPKTPPPAPAALPIARPVIAQEVPAASPVGAAPAALNFHSTSELVVPRTRRSTGKNGSRSLLSWVLFALLGVAGLALLAWGGIWLRSFLKRTSTDEEPGRMPSVYNSRFSWPGKPWKRDKDIQVRLHVHIGMTSTEHNSGLGLVFKDYKNRRPSDAEMLDEALSKLRSYFKGLEWELKKDEKARLAGQPAQVVEFQGVDAEDVTMNGECYMTTFRGYGYWFFTWAPLGELEQERDPIHADWVQLRQRLALLDERKGWTERPPEMVKVAGKKATYQIAYIKGLWTRETTEDYDPQADLVLKGHEPDPERKPLAGKDATVEVLVLSKQADLKSAAAAARSYVMEREKKLYPRTTAELLKDKNGAEIARAADIGTERGHLSKLRLKSTEDLERYLLIAVVSCPEGVVALVGQCLWERHDFWDQELMVLLKTFKAKAR
jgi:hypothetical protein